MLESVYERVVRQKLHTLSSRDCSILLLYCGGNGKHITRFNQKKLNCNRKRKRERVERESPRERKNQRQVRELLRKINEAEKARNTSHEIKNTERKKLIDDEGGRVVYLRK